MTGSMKTSNRIVLLMTAVCLWVAFGMLFGCAHQQAAQSDQTRVEADAEAPVSILNTPRTIEENGAVYQITETPFGVVKRRIPVGERTQGLPDDARTSLTAAEAAPIAPDPRPVPPAKTAVKNTDKIIFREATAPAGTQPGQVTLNFDDADLYEVIRTMAELLEINYIVDPRVKGKVTIQTAGSLSKDDLLPIFYQILETNGLTAVKEGPIYKIAPIKDANRMPITARFGRSDIPLSPTDRIILQIIPLKNIDAEQMVKILTPFVSADGTIISHKESNTLILVDKGINILKALKLVEAFDIDLFYGVSHRFYKIEFNSVEDIAKPLSDVLAAYAGGSKKEVKLIPIKHLNMLLVLSSEPRLFDRVAQMIETLDTPNETVQPRLYVYSVKNGEAEELAGLLNQIFQSRSSDDQRASKSEPKDKKPDADKRNAQGNPFIKKAPKESAEAKPLPVAAGDAFGSGTLRGEIKITDDQTRNALVIEAIPSDYRIVQFILDRLDVMPRQVLIEAMIAEIKLDDSTKFGVEWNYVQGDGGSLSTALLSATMGAAGMMYNIGQTDRWSATLTALASENKVNILSTPTVLASNDKAATINISTEVPVASAQYQFNDASTQPVVTTNIEYRNTGIILDVTPHINENGLVSMDIRQEVSEQSGDVIVGGQPYPSFFQRSVQTTLTAGHAQTIVIGGLIRENKSTGQAGVPAISKIPIIGPLFGTNSRTNSKSELIILITPRVIINLTDVEKVTEDFKARVPNVY